MLKSLYLPTPYSGASRSSRASVPARIDSCSPASLPTTRISVPTRAPSGYSGSAAGRDVTQLERIVTIEAEVVHGIAIDRAQLDFLAILEHCRRHDRSGRDHVPVGQDQAALRVDDEAGRLARLVPLGVERAGLVDLDRDDRGRDAFERMVPGRVLLRRVRRGCAGQECHHGQPRSSNRTPARYALETHRSRPNAARKRCLNSFMSKR